MRVATANKPSRFFLEVLALFFVFLIFLIFSLIYKDFLFFIFLYYNMCYPQGLICDEPLVFERKI
jgi:hypothetical protein